MRVYDTSHLQGQGLISSALRDYRNAKAIGAEAEQRDQQKLLFQQRQEDRSRNLARQDVLEGRNDAAYEQQLIDDETNRQRSAEAHARQGVLQGREDEMYKEGVQDRATQRERDADDHAFKQYERTEYKNQDWYRKKQQKLNIELQNHNISNAKKNGIKKDFEMNQQKRAENIQNVADEMRRVEASIKAGDIKGASASYEKLVKLSGFEDEDLNQTIEIMEVAANSLASGKTKLDDPKLLKALNLQHKTTSAVDGRKSEIVAMIKTPKGYIPKFKMEDGSTGFQTYGQSSNPEDIGEAFTAPEILEKLMSNAAMAKNMQKIKDTYGLNPPPKEEKDLIKVGDRLYDPNIGEVVLDSTAGTATVGGDATPLMQKNADILAESFKDDPDSAMAHNVLIEAGIVSKAAVSQAKELAQKLEVEVPQAAEMLVQQKKNREGIPKLKADLLENNPELKEIESYIDKTLRKEFKRADGNVQNALDKIKRKAESVKDKKEYQSKIDAAMEEGRKRTDERLGEAFKKTPIQRLKEMFKKEN